MDNPPVAAPLPFPLDPNTLTALRKGGFILYGKTTIGDDGTLSIKNSQIKAGSTPFVLPTTGSSGGYIGQIRSNAAGTVFPPGWSLTYVSAIPFYTVNHTLTGDFVVLATVKNAAGTPLTPSWYPDSSTSFRIYVNSSSTGATTADVDFAVFPASGGSGVSVSCENGQLIITGTPGVEIAYLIIL